MKKSLSLLLCLTLLAGLLILPAGAEEIAPDPMTPPTPSADADVWDGTTKQPTKLVDKDGVKYFEITTAEELAYIAQEGGDWLTYNYILANDLILNDVEIQVDEDGNCTNGNNLKQWTPIGSSSRSFSGVFDGGDHIISGLYINDSGSYLGLFGYASKISNLISVNAYVKGGGQNVGGIAGSSSYITHCVNYGTVTGSGVYVGGIAGDADSVTNCANYGAVTGSGSYVGGIAGSSTYIAYCVNYGAVTGSGSEEGGIAGSSDSVANCVNYGAVTGTGSGLGGLGGIVGCTYDSYDPSNTYNTSTITHCVNYGTVTGREHRVGGIAGFGSFTTCCVNYGTVTGRGHGVGGIAGYSYSFTTCCVNYGAVTGSSGVGGITGDADHITHCVNYGTVTGDGDRVGGIAGISFCPITHCANLAAVSGAGKVGGIAGECANSDLTHCYNIGPVTATWESDLAGGIAGKSDHWQGDKSKVTNCYYAADSASSAFGNPSLTQDEENVAEAKTLAELKAQGTFVGWDFENDWLIDPEVNGGYPLPSGLPGETVPVIGVSLKESALSLAEGDVSYLTVQFSPDNATGTCKWKSSDPAVAAVGANGRVEAKGPGTATVTVTCGGFSAACTVTVTDRTGSDYRIGTLVLRDDKGEAVETVPAAGGFWVTVPITKTAEIGGAEILLATYGPGNAFTGLLCADVSGLNAGQTIQLRFYIDRPGVERVKAMAISSLSDLTPLGAAAEVGK